MAKGTKKILIIDDELALARAVELHLEVAGRFETKVETKGQKALQTALAFKPDFILLDVNMPDLNGFEVMYQLEAHPELKDVPVVFLTAAFTKEGPTGDPSHDDFMIGKYPYLSKPFSPEDLYACIDKYLE